MRYLWYRCLSPPGFIKTKLSLVNFFGRAYSQTLRMVEASSDMENDLHNDLIRRGYSVDVGVVEQNVRVDAGKNPVNNWR